VELDERLATQVRGQHTASQLLTAATVDGHRSIGWADAGALVVGGLADLVSVRLDSVRTAGATPHTALAAAVFAASAADVHHVVSGGRVVVRDSQHIGLDVATELARTIAIVQEDR
jgi:cytosine/adenosine deaminase-related metal-dependent hydrolase